MKYLIIYLFLMPLTLSAQIKMDLDDNKLNGSIKKMVEYQCSLFADSNRNRIPDLTCIYTYNEQLKQEIAYCYWGVDSLHCRYKNIFNYNNKGILETQEYYEENKLNSKITYKYDSNDRLVEYMVEWIYGTPTIKQYKYDSIGNKTEEYDCIRRCEKIIYTYDTNNYVIRKDTYKSDTLYSKTIFFYDSAYHYSMEDTKSIGYSYECKTVRRYDDRMNLIAEIPYVKSCETKNVFEKDRPVINCEYKYDKKNNWVEQTYYLYGKIDSYTKREITY